MVKILSSKIARFLNSSLIGEDILINHVTSINKLKPYALVFLNQTNNEAIECLNENTNILCITTKEISERIHCPRIIVNNPRLAFALIMNSYFLDEVKNTISSSATIAKDAKLGENIAVGPNSFVDNGVKIGSGSVISSNVSITGNVTIGKNCIVKANTTIGEAGFGFVKNENNIPVPFPHIGRVIIMDNVEIGANCTVARAAIDETIIHENVKTDDQVHIAHNCTVGSGTFIAAGVILSGSVVIGKNVWISPNSTIKDQLTIGDDVFIGIGSVVTKSIQTKVRVFGNPAKPIGTRKSEDE